MQTEIIAQALTELEGEDALTFSKALVNYVVSSEAREDAETLLLAGSECTPGNATAHYTIAVSRFLQAQKSLSNLLDGYAKLLGANNAR